MSKGASRAQRLVTFLGTGFLFLVASLSAVAVFFIFYFIAKDAIPFFELKGFKEFFTSTKWYPSGDPAEFGTLAIFVGSGLVTLGAAVVAIPLGVSASVCLSDVLPFRIRQLVKPVIEILAAIPSVAYGFFALVIFAPLLQEKGGHLLEVVAWAIGAPVLFVVTIVLSELIAKKISPAHFKVTRIIAICCIGIAGITGLYFLGRMLGNLTVESGTNALNVSIILGIMALPTVVSVSEDALQAIGREMREGSYALGATRAETLLKVIIPAAGSGISAAVILGLMRAIGETMVVWMASGNAAQIPVPWFNYLKPVRTLTATIAGDMGEADHVTGSARYHVLFAMALCLLTISFICNLSSEWIVARSRKRQGM
jgi:phosphate transport system permease protein